MSTTNIDGTPGVIVPRPAQLQDAVRLANEALQQLGDAIGALDESEDYDDLYNQLEDARRDLESAIGYMTAVPEVEYLGQHVHTVQS